MKLSHAGNIALLCAACLYGYGVLVFWGAGAFSLDYGTIFLAGMQQQLDALAEGHVLLWDPIQYGGTAWWPLPNTAPAYPPLLAALALLGAVKGLGAAVLLHVLWGALGCYALVQRLGGRRFAALVAGLVYALGRFTDHLAFVMPLESMALAWVPWTFLCLVAGLHARRWWAWSAAAALTFAATPWVGGYIVMPRGLLLCAVLIVFASWRRPLGPQLRRGAAVGLVFLGLFLLLAAGRLLPTLAWIPLTNRAVEMSAEDALLGAVTLPELLPWLRAEGLVPVGLLLAGLLLGVRRRFDWVLPFSAVFVVVLVLSEGTLHRALLEHVPGLGRIREPRRAWVLMPVALAIGAGLGTMRLQDRLRGGALQTGGAVLLLGLLLADMVATPEPFVPYRLTSYDDRLDADRLHLYLARRAEIEPRFRVHDYADTRARLKRTADLIHSHHRLEALEGVLGNISVTAYDEGFIDPSRLSPARAWGLMNVGFVTSHEPLDVDGLDLVREFPDDPNAWHPGSDGPFLYRNEHVMPRAYFVSHALLQVGGTPLKWGHLMLCPEWDPRTTVIVRAEVEDLAGRDAAFFRRFDGVLFHEEETAAMLSPRVEAAGVPHHLDAGARDEWFAWVSATLEQARSAHEVLPDPPREWNQITVALPAAAAGRWLVLAETCALYPGWDASWDADWDADFGNAAAPPELFIANGAATAVPLPRAAERPQRVELEYEPPAFKRGMALSLTGLALCAALLMVRPRRREG